ncbi:HAMP domain-containing sensor histidine kinase [Actinomadura sp. DC4]|uniref:sensor histidine kinase n=1 Tax=Actinomadura sp. DC4 TaxID=3055069 RepID=UPI0025B11D46|nr:HAMP domain-containing sensor histidine kinase [Actinomadura sp. DC4]MDN3354750.1 HAMP domain-containing sensor histidine kinase [Actinomadura sp. DC4]
MRSLPRVRLPRFGGVRLRATAAAMLTVAVALGVASTVLLLVLQGSLEKSARAEAADKAKAVATAVKVGGPGAPPAPPGSAGMGLPPDGDVQVLSSNSTGSVWKSGAGYTVAMEQVDGRGGSVLVQGRSSLAPTRQAIVTLWSLLLPGVPALLLLVGLLTWLAVGRALKPVSAIRGKLADITAHDLHQRVPEPESRDEIAALARTVNATLDRLQTAVEQHKRFVADAAHELRSPLAILRTRLEVAGAEAPALADQALTDVERIQTLTADLLLLSRLDAGEPLREREVDLGQVVAEEAAQPRPRPDVTVDLDVASDVLVRGSGGQLKRLTANLVDNAVRHAATTVTVRLTADGSSAALEVADDGPGIPEEHREVVFDRFTRLDQARARDSGGSGLGLAIARDIATAHQGTLTVAARPAPGACLRAVLPTSPG